MKNKSFCNLAWRRRATNKAWILFGAAVVSSMLSLVPRAVAGGDAAPGWMHSLTGNSLPTYDEKTNAVMLFSQTDITVVSADKIKTHVREAYKILRPGGRHYGLVAVPFSVGEKVTTIKGWCIPAQGKDYEVKEKDAIERSDIDVDGGELMNDLKFKVIHIPAAEPGNIVGYEYEVEKHPLLLQDDWFFQDIVPVRESHLTLQLPSGWEYKASWLNYPEVKATQAGSNTWQWSVSNLSEIKEEPQMPPFRGLAGQMLLAFFPSGGFSTKSGFNNWQEMGTWYTNLLEGRLDASPQIKQQVAALTAGKTTQLQKMQALAAFVQRDIRYVAIELGIGGWQPHASPDVFAHKYGDCKDKATLMRTMLHEIGIDSYHVVINTERGAVNADTPAHRGGFNHAILAIKLPDDVNDPSLLGVMQDPKLGRILFFDPTNDLIPFGEIPGYEQASYALLVAPGGGELVRLPQQASLTNSILRTGKLTLEPSGVLKGDVVEMRFGDRASYERRRQQTVTNDADRIKPIETLLAGSLSTFQITHASLQNLTLTDKPFGFNYSFEAANYAKNAGDLLLVRPRVLGNKAQGLLETKEARRFPIEFEGPARDTDSFEITIPAGYVVDDLPPAVDADYSFASYHSRTEVKGNVIGYNRTFEVKELSVPVNKADDLKKFYRIIANDERNTVVLKSVK